MDPTNVNNHSSAHGTRAIICMRDTRSTSLEPYRRNRAHLSLTVLAGAQPQLQQLLLSQVAGPHAKFKSVTPRQEPDILAFPRGPPERVSSRSTATYLVFCLNQSSMYSISSFQIRQF